MDILKRLLLTLILVATIATHADSQYKAKDFNEAYKAYQSAVQTKDLELIANAAEKAMKISKALNGAEHQNTAIMSHYYAQASYMNHVTKRTIRQNAKDLVKQYNDLIDLYEKVFGDDSELLIDPLMELGAIYTSYMANPKSGTRRFKQALRIADELGEEPKIKYANLAMEAGERLYPIPSAGKDALRFFRQAHTIFSENLQKDDARLIKASHGYALALYSASKLSDSEELLVSVYDAYARADLQNHPRAMMAASVLVKIYEQMDETEKANNFSQVIGQYTPWKEDQQQTPLFILQPEWPQDALRRGLEGSVYVSFIIDKNGMVQNPEVINYEGNAMFKKSALKAIKEWRFAPKFENGEPVDAASFYKLEFKLTRRR